MAHTFDIRFARSTGLAAFLQAPTNTFRWKGAGRLGIDPEGISIAARRGVLALFPHTRRVSAADFKGVLREGEALRVEFSTAKDSRAVVLFWVRDQETAEEIVRLLPTTRTVELNHDAAGVAQARVGIDWRALSLLAVVLVAIVGGVWMLQRSDAPAPVIQADAQVAAPQSGASAAPSEGSMQPVEVPNPAEHSAIAAPPNVQAGDAQDAPGVDLPVELAAPDPDAPAETTPEPVQAQPTTSTPAADADAYARTVRRAQATEGVVPIVPGMPAYAAARRQLDLFMSETAELRGNCGAAARWWQVSVRIYNDPEFNNPALWPLQEMELAVSRAWRSCNSAGGSDERVRSSGLRIAWTRTCAKPKSPVLTPFLSSASALPRPSGAAPRCCPTAAW